VTPSLDSMEHEKPQGSENAQVYEPPTVTDYGSLAEMTAGGTPAGDLTFSG
jgi:hypothetical protein